jgi:3-oxoacyl-[acyl-carrier protein] reductase
LDLGLSGKVALISGGSRGLGKAIAEELGQEGARVSICARSKQDLDQVVQDLRNRRITAMSVVADVTILNDIKRVADSTTREFGRIDVLVNNAGDAWLTHTVNTTDDEWRYCMDVNLHSAIRFTREVVPLMRKQGGGRIINISTIAAHTPFAAVAMDYFTAKAGMLAFSKALSIELAPDNILVNCVCPGFIYSDLGSRLADSAIGLFGNTREEVYQMIANQFVTLKRIGRAEEVSGLVAFLASDRASYITGSIYDIDGGIQKSI